MSGHQGTHSRVHDLFGAFLGAFALAMLLTIRWQVDTSGPNPFYKGPLIFPLLVLSLLLGASLPSVWRLVSPPKGASWHLDGQGFPQKGIRVLGLLVLYLGGLVYVGLEASTLAFLLVSLWMVNQRSKAKILGIPLGVTAILYFVFKYFLDVWFPTPILWELLTG